MRLAIAAAMCVAGLALGFGADTAVITIRAYPALVTWRQPVTVSGQIEQSAAGELVTIEGRECGVPGGFHALAAAQTTAGGGWTVEYNPRVKTTLRAAWQDDTSTQLTVLVRAPVNLVPISATRVSVSTYAVGRVDGKRISIQRFDTDSRTWRSLKTVVLESSYAEYAERRNIKIGVPKGTTLRAVLPLSQAKPCYLAGYSKLIRT
jgi:hypothetical protein